MPQRGRRASRGMVIVLLGSIMVTSIWTSAYAHSTGVYLGGIANGTTRWYDTYHLQQSSILRYGCHIQWSNQQSEYVTKNSSASLYFGSFVERVYDVINYDGYPANRVEGGLYRIINTPNGTSRSWNNLLGYRFIDGNGASFTTGYTVANISPGYEPDAQFNFAVAGQDCIAADDVLYYPY